MAEKRKDRLPHLLVRGTATTGRYTSPRDGRGTTLNLSPRNRAQHAEAPHPANQGSPTTRSKHYSRTKGVWAGCRKRNLYFLRE